MTVQEASIVQDIDQDTIYALAVSPDFTQDSLCFAARRSGLWRSGDGGATWQLVEPPEDVTASLAATSILFTPDFASDRGIFAGVHGGIVRSTDRGGSWKSTALASPPPFVSALGVSPDYAVDGMIFAATLEDGVFSSRDRGETWQAWNFGLFDMNCLSIAVSPGFAQDRTVFVGADSGVFYSKNGGRAWRETGFPIESAPVLSLGISSRFAQDGVLLAGTESSGLFRSDDRGRTWQRVLNVATVNAVLPSPIGPAMDFLALTSHAVWQSHDGGQSWSNRYPDRPFDPGITAAALASRPSGSDLLLGLADGRIVWV